MNRGFRCCGGVLGLCLLLGCGEKVEEEGSGEKREGGAASEGRGAGQKSAASTKATAESPSKLPRGEGRVRDSRPAPNSHPVGIWIPGRPGYILNPYTNNSVDVRGIPPGTLVLDPQSADRTEAFRVPPLPKTEDAEGENGDGSDGGGATN